MTTPDSSMLPAGTDRQPRPARGDAGSRLPDAGAASPTARLFVGLWPDAQALDGVLRWQAACGFPTGARPVPAARIHLTLHFLGDVARDRLPELCRALDVASPPLELSLAQARVWPGGIAVLEPAGEAPPALAALHARLGEVLRELGLPLETRAFRPHVTLARRASGAVLPPRQAPVPWAAGAHVLVESDRGYRVLQEFRWPAG